MKKRFAYVRGLISRERDRLAIFATVVLVSVLGFEAGVITAHSSPSKPMIIEVPGSSLIVQEGKEKNGKIDTMSEGEKEVRTSSPNGTSASECPLVGSKNSTLYHLPTCAPAKRIKPENRVCFKDADDAEKRGYKPGCLK